MYNVHIYIQGCTKGQKSGGAGSNAARRRCPAAPSDLPKSGGAAAPPASPIGASLTPPGQRLSLAKAFSATSSFLTSGPVDASGRRRRRAMEPKPI